jgi:hypothetical protein
MTGVVFRIKSVPRRHTIDTTESYTAERDQLSGRKPLGGHEVAGKGPEAKEFNLTRTGMTLSIIYKP